VSTVYIFDVEKTSLAKKKQKKKKERRKKERMVPSG